jgi:hypothetical protein
VNPITRDSVSPEMNRSGESHHPRLGQPGNEQADDDGAEHQRVDQEPAAANRFANIEFGGK